ncbi:hypothetical protein M514_20843 [Trichuris suis]|uniref:Uncharacterized protein n=1 Tax=Trichuris suis TaxID=68888 RepID=A0A085NBY1_9BILA|nr:hypothetical protein M514_20843 [Trichuris suis]
MDENVVAIFPQFISERQEIHCHRFGEHMKHLITYRNAKNILENVNIEVRRERPPRLRPSVAMDRALKASAVAKHAAHCDNVLQPRIVFHECHLRKRKIKESLYIRHNFTYNWDQSVDVSEVWPHLIEITKCCSISNGRHVDNELSRQPNETA